MSDRPARVYRVVAHYEDRVITRDFLTKRARDGWANLFREGQPAEEGWGDEYGYWAIKKAKRVEIYNSAPVEWIEGEQWKN